MQEIMITIFIALGIIETITMSLIIITITVIILTIIIITRILFRKIHKIILKYVF